MGNSQEIGSGIVSFGAFFDLVKDATYLELSSYPWRKRGNHDAGWELMRLGRDAL